VLTSLFDGEGAKINRTLKSPAARKLIKGRETVGFHRDSQRPLKDILRQLDRKRQEYRKSREEQIAFAAQELEIPTRGEITELPVDPVAVLAFDLERIRG